VDDKQSAFFGTHADYHDFSAARAAEQPFAASAAIRFFR
jgi:hypothetical protein